MGSRLFAKGSQGHRPRVSLRLPKAQGRGEGLRPCLGNVVSYTWVCGILFTWLPPLRTGFPQQAPIVPRKRFCPRGLRAVLVGVELLLVKLPGCGKGSHCAWALWSLPGQCMAFPSPCNRHLGAFLHVEKGFPVGSRFLSKGSQCCAPLFSLLLPEAQGGWEGLEHGWALWFLPEKWKHLLYVATTTCERVCTSGKLFPWESVSLRNGSQGLGPRVSLRLPKAQGRGEGLRP